MTRAREQQISLSDTPYYHCVNRCVRRAFLCGEDRVTGQNYDHRKQWIVDQIKLLSSVFAIDVCAYAVMSNHYHVVLKVDVERVAAWSDVEVLQRWRRLFKGNFLVDRYLSDQSLTKAELNLVEETTAVWRLRLQDISWFMRCLNESIARQANDEDGVKGRFWEGRFRSQALLDEQALLSCMMYVDLNPIRAGLATTPESSEYTSIYERIEAMCGLINSPKKRGRPRREAVQRNSEERCADQNKSRDRGVNSPNVSQNSHLDKRFEVDEMAPLVAFSDQLSAVNRDDVIPFSFVDYLELLEWTGRAIRTGKRGSIPTHLQPILTRLGVADGDHWVEHIGRFMHRFASYAGSSSRLRQQSRQLGLRWIKGQAA